MIFEKNLIINSHPISSTNDELNSYLTDKIGLTEEALQLGIRQSKIENAPLPVVLWTFGLINLNQYIDIIKWQEET